MIKSGGVGGGSGTPAPAARPSRSAANDGPVVVRESMCELVYSKDALTESMLGKLKQAFKLPVQDPSKVQMFNPDLRRKSLGFSKKPGTWTPAPYSAPALIPPSAGDGVPAEDEYTHEELVLWTPPPVDAPAGAVVGEAETSTAGAADADGAEVSRAAASAPTAPVAPSATTISVDGFLCRWLREHQREGVQFLFDCCMGLRDYEGEGCILADDMGLGERSSLVPWMGIEWGRVGWAGPPGAAGWRCARHCTLVLLAQSAGSAGPFSSFMEPTPTVASSPRSFRRQDTAVHHHLVDAHDPGEGRCSGGDSHHRDLPGVPRHQLGERAQHKVDQGGPPPRKGDPDHCGERSARAIRPVSFNLEWFCDQSRWYHEGFDACVVGGSHSYKDARVSPGERKRDLPLPRPCSLRLRYLRALEAHASLPPLTLP